MGISIQAYRCSIGRFVPKHSRIDFHNYSARSCNKNPSKSSSIRTYLLLIILLCVPIVCALLGHNSVKNMSKTYKHPVYPSFSAQSSNTNISGSGKVSTDLATTYILQYGIHVIASFSSRMISNFYSRYLNGNRKSGGIKISHWNKGPGFLQNKLP